jgi:hypothetical protein
VPLAARAKQLKIAVRPELFTLVQYNYGQLGTLLFRDVECPVTAQYHTWFVSLPALFGDPPPFTALRPPQPGGRLSDRDELVHIGLYTGDASAPPPGSGDCIPADCLRQLLILEGVRWHNLQSSDSARDAGMSDSDIVAPAGPFRTFADMANMISTLDAVVTVDSPVCHLAASLGVSGIVLLTSDASFRWGLGHTTPWYPTLELIRQRTADDWPAVVQAAAERIKRFVEERSRVHRFVPR